MICQWHKETCRSTCSVHRTHMLNFPGRGQNEETKSTQDQRNTKYVGECVKIYIIGAVYTERHHKYFFGDIVWKKLEFTAQRARVSLSILYDDEESEEMVNRLDLLIPCFP